MTTEIIKASEIRSKIQLRSYEKTFHQMILRDSSPDTRIQNRHLSSRLEKFCRVA